MSSVIIQAIRVEDGIFWFDLQETIVSAIQEIQIQQSSSRDTLLLTVPRWLRRWLQKASVFDITEETAKIPTPPRENQGLLPPVPTLPRIQQSGMTFISCYPSPENGNKRCILETIVSLDGDILNKVNRQLLESELAAEISAAHFWLIDQLLLALRQETDWLLQAITGFFVGMPVGVALLLQYDGTLEMTDVIGPIVGSGFSSLIYSLKNYWRPWIHAHLSRLGWNLVKKYFLKKQLGFSG
jgi:hypothetical protein